MHPDLSSHLHTEECNILIAQLQKCHDEHPFKKFYGYCNSFDLAMGKCLNKEREMKRKANIAKRDRNKKTHES